MDDAHFNPDDDGGAHPDGRARVVQGTDRPLRRRGRKARYGPIAPWDTSGITSMHALFINSEDVNEGISRWNVSNVVDMATIFCRATWFNGDLSSWDVGQVESMYGMFETATSFTHELGGAWSSTADNAWMFADSPGTIAGKVKAADGTIE